MSRHTVRFCTLRPPCNAPWRKSKLCELSRGPGPGNPNTISKWSRLVRLCAKQTVYKDVIGFDNLSSMPSSPPSDSDLPPYSPPLTFPPITGSTTRTALSSTSDPYDFLPWIRRIRFEANQNNRILSFSNATKTLEIWHW